MKLVERSKKRGVGKNTRRTTTRTQPVVPIEQRRPPQQTAAEVSRRKLGGHEERVQRGGDKEEGHSAAWAWQTHATRQQPHGVTHARPPCPGSPAVHRAQQYGTKQATPKTTGTGHRSAGHPSMVPIAPPSTTGLPYCSSFSMAAVGLRRVSDGRGISRPRSSARAAA